MVNSNIDCSDKTRFERVTVYKPAGFERVFSKM